MNDLVKNTGIYMAVRASVAVIGVATTIIFSRIIPPAIYGDFAVVVSSAMIIEAICFTWLGSSVLRLLPSESGEARAFLGSVVALYLGACAVIAAGVGVFALVNPEYTSGFLIYAALLAMVQGWLGVTLQYLTSRVMTRPFMITLVARVGCMFLCGVVLGYLYPSVLGLIGASIASCVVALALSQRFVAALRVAPTLCVRNVRLIAVYGIPVASTLGLLWVVEASDRLLLYHLMGPEIAGKYALVYDLASRPFTLALSAMSSAALPMAVRTFERGGGDAARPLLSHAATILLALGVPILIGETVLAADVSHLVLGEHYAALSTEIMPLVGLATMIGGFRLYYLDYNFHLSKRTLVLAAEWTIAAVLNVGLNLLLIPRFGAVGAAYATVIAYAILYLTFLVARDRSIPTPLPAAGIAKIVLAGVAMAAVLKLEFPLPPAANLVCVGLLGGIAYLAVLYVCDLAGMRAWINARLAARFRVAGQESP
ncbi:oligosaccharide flippase family protein [Azospirillum sp. sgz302134]